MPCVFLLCFLSCSGTKDLGSGIDQEGYDGINALYSENELPIYYKTIEQPSWAQLISYDSIFSRSSYPIRIADEQLKTHLNQKDLN